jgi:L-lactate dehydrogenase complex protein LldG
MSKEKILAAIRKTKPTAVDLPELPVFPQDDAPALDVFIKTAEAVGIKVIHQSNLSTIHKVIRDLFPKAPTIVSPLTEIKTTKVLNPAGDPHDLSGVDVAILRAHWGVAENGALWVTEKDCGHRVLPFITQHLVLLLDQQALVKTMHEAYQKIKIDDTGLGLFIAGPSKTADIEQSLVIGAQGARSLTVFIHSPDS